MEKFTRLLKKYNYNIDDKQLNN